MQTSTRHRTEAARLNFICLAILVALSSVRASAQGIYTAFYEGIPGVLVSDLTNDSAFPDNPSSTTIRSLFEPYPGDQGGDNFGTRMVGYFSPPESANYNFYITAADTAVLHLSTNDDPTNKVLIASEPNSPGNLGHPFLGTVNRNPTAPENRSTTLFPGGIPLVAGQKYFIEALHKTATGVDDILAVAVEGGSLPAVTNGAPGIDGAYLTTAVHEGPAAILVQPTDQTVVDGRRATFTFRVDGTPPYTLRLLRLGFFEVATGMLHTGSGYGRLTTPPVSRTEDDGATYNIEVIGPDASVATSMEVTLHVTPDTDAPALVRVAGSNTLDSVLVVFSEPMELASAQEAFNYAITNQNGDPLSLTSATLLGDDRTVLLTTAPQSPGSRYCVVVNDVRDASSAHNVIAPNSTACFEVPALAITHHPQSIGAPERGRATFSVRAVAVTALSYQWQQAAAGSEDFVDIPGATSSNYTHSPVLLSDHGARFRCRVSASGSDIDSRDATLSVIYQDLQRPMVVVVGVGPGLATVWVRFSEPVDATTATMLANYTIGGPTISDAVLDPAGDLVTLTTSPLTAGGSYTLRVSNVKDSAAAGNTILPDTQIPFTATAQGYAEAVLADGPVVYLPFEEAAGETVAKNLGNLGAPADGTYSPATTGEASGLVPPAFRGFSPANRAASFAGAQKITVSEANVLSMLGTNVLKDSLEFTIEVWAKPAFTSGRGGIVSQPANGVHFKWVSPFTIQVASDGGGFGGNIGYSFPSGEWHHLAAVGNTSDLKVYYDANLVLQGGSGGTAHSKSDANIVIGGGSDIWGNSEDVELLQGQLDEVAMYRKALTQADLKRHYDAAIGSVPLGPNRVTLITLSQGHVVIDWIAPGILQSAPNVTGPWNDVAGAVAPPYATALPSQRTFWRVARR